MDRMKEAREDYIAGRGSYRVLSRRYGIPPSTLSPEGRRGGWGQLREQRREEAEREAGTVTRFWFGSGLGALGENGTEASADGTEKTPEDGKGDEVTCVYRVADRLLQRAAAMAEEETLSVRDLRALTSALKDLKCIRDLRSAMDAQEQAARIERLLRAAEQKEAEQIVVRIGEEAEEFAG